MQRKEWIQRIFLAAQEYRDMFYLGTRSQELAARKTLFGLFEMKLGAHPGREKKKKEAPARVGKAPVSERK